MLSNITDDFNKRFRRRVLLPGAVVLLVTALLCGGALIGVGRGNRNLALIQQSAETYRMKNRVLNDLPLAQELVGLCEACVKAASADPNQAWFDKHVGFPLFDLYNVHETYILDSANRPVYASVRRKPGSPSAYERVAPSVDRLVKLARGEIRRARGSSGSLHERLPGLPPQPFIVQPEGGWSVRPYTVFPTLSTTPGVVHATDLVRIGDRVALASVMQMSRSGSHRPPIVAPAPLLVSLRYLDDQFLLEASRLNYLYEARLADSPELRGIEASVPLTNGDSEFLTNLVWKPRYNGAVANRGLLLPAAGMFGVIALLVLLMALGMRRLMKSDDERLIELHQAHLELKAKEAQAHHLAYHDVLTGLPNRALFTDNADQAAIRARHGEPVAVLLLDLDRFKNVNDRFGHFAGDALIQEVAQRLTRVLTRPDAVARLGGDEFAILLQQEDLDDSIETTLNRILEDLRRPYELFGNQAHIGVSIGVARAPEYGTDRVELMRKADIALYRAKDEGRDCYRFFTESMDETVQLRATLEADLREAMASGTGLTVHYQPLIDAPKSKVSGLEALLRWHHPTRGWIPPHLFVPVAEETGLISALGDWVLGQACEVAREWPHLSIAVNLSPVQFCDERFAARACALVRAEGVKPQQIEFEVTEAVVLDQNDTVRNQLRHLREEGFRIALDDFGTGYSSLNYLRDFEVDRIKIDRSFIHSLGQSLDAGAIVTAVVTLGHAMGLQVTAEGVENSEQEDFLKAAGCNVLQGFLFSRAVPAYQLRGSLGREGIEEAA